MLQLFTSVAAYNLVLRPVFLLQRITCYTPIGCTLGCTLDDLFPAILDFVAAAYTCKFTHTCDMKTGFQLDACLQERLKAQKEEAASNPEYGSTYKPQSSKEDRTAKRKQILSNIGMVPLLCQDAVGLISEVLQTTSV